MQQLTIILASDEFVASEEFDAVRAKAAAEGFTIEDAATDDTQALRYAIGTPSLFGDGRLIVVRDAQDLPPDAQDAIEQWSQVQAEGIALVLVGNGVAAQKLAKRLTRATIVKAEGVPPWKAGEWTAKRAAGKGRRMSAAAAAALVEAVGSELRDLAGALDRLLEVTSEPIEPLHIHAQFRSVESRMYQFVDAVFDRDVSLARKRLHALLDQGDSAIGLVASLHRQLRVVAVVASGDSRPPAAIAKDLGLKSEGAVKRAQRQARGFTPARLARAYRLLVEADLALKSEEDDPLVLELLVDEIASR